MHPVGDTCGWWLVSLAVALVLPSRHTQPAHTVSHSIVQPEAGRRPALRWAGAADQGQQPAAHLISSPLLSAAAAAAAADRVQTRPVARRLPSRAHPAALRPPPSAHRDAPRRAVATSLSPSRRSWRRRGGLCVRVLPAAVFPHGAPTCPSEKCCVEVASMTSIDLISTSTRLDFVPLIDELSMSTR